MYNTFDLSNLDVLEMLNTHILSFISSNKKDKKAIFTIRKSDAFLTYSLNCSDERPEEIISHVDVMRLFNRHCIYNTRFQFVPLFSSTTAAELAIKILAVTEQDGDNKTDGQCLDEIYEIINSYVF